MSRVLCPAQAGVLSAFGLIASEFRRDLAKTVLLDEAAIADGRLAAEVESICEQLADEQMARLEIVYEVRYAGQSFELDIVPGSEGLAALRPLFEGEHERRYGYSDPEAGIEIVGVRAAALGERPELPDADGGDPETSLLERPARFDGEELPTAILKGGLPAGGELAGPAVIELAETTLLVPPGTLARRVGAQRDTEIMLEPMR
jgi:N-methylhydantoinase A